MRPPLMMLFVVGFIVTNVGASLFFKVAADHAGWAAFRYWLFGNLVGIGAPLSLMLALRGGNPNVIYALCFGGGFCVLQLASYWLFRQPLSVWQWAGVAITALGILLLQIR